MSPGALIAVALLLALVAMSFAFAGGAVIVAVPLALILAAGVAFFDMSRRRKQVKDVQQFREQAKAEKVDFTERDKETLTSE